MRTASEFRSATGPERMDAANVLRWKHDRRTRAVVVGRRVGDVCQSEAGTCARHQRPSGAPLVSQ